ncbi:MAG: TonB-dependent receptor, partial [Flammeovirgaceae bacterium]|nr:TonB-dependent receptor [Flammeovirgaceae bacterium]
MKEQRNILAIRYAPRKEHRKLNYELTTSLQNHAINWYMRYYPNNTVDGYPQGLTEYLQTNAKSLFGRVQADYQHQLGTLLAGTEYTFFYYNGDKQHYSNVNLGNDYLPFPDNEWQKVGDWLEFITNKPVNSLGTFAQYISPKLWQQLQLTLSGRYDALWFDYHQIFKEGKPIGSKNYRQFTPRASLVWTFSPSLSFKWIAGRAFRYPTPTEMFGANTFTLASNIEGLNPETIINYDWAVNWKKNDIIDLAFNVFWIDFRDQIAYSEANANLSTNIYSLKTAGVELATKLNHKKWSGFFNYTYSRRLNEQIQDTLISSHP